MTITRVSAAGGADSRLLRRTGPKRGSSTTRVRRRRAAPTAGCSGGPARSGDRRPPGCSDSTAEREAPPTVVRDSREESSSGRPDASAEPTPSRRSNSRAARAPGDSVPRWQHSARTTPQVGARPTPRSRKVRPHRCRVASFCAACSSPCSVWAPAPATTPWTAPARPRPAPCPRRAPRPPASPWPSSNGRDVSIATPRSEDWRPRTGQSGSAARPVTSATRGAPTKSWPIRAWCGCPGTSTGPPRPAASSTAIHKSSRGWRSR